MSQITDINYPQNHSFVCGNKEELEHSVADLTLDVQSLRQECLSKHARLKKITDIVLIAATIAILIGVASIIAGFFIFPPFPILAGLGIVIIACLSVPLCDDAGQSYKNAAEELEDEIGSGGATEFVHFAKQKGFDLSIKNVCKVHKLYQKEIVHPRELREWGHFAYYDGYRISPSHRYLRL